MSITQQAASRAQHAQQDTSSFDSQTGIEIVVPELKSAALVIGLFGLGLTLCRRRLKPAAKVAHYAI